MEAVATLPTYIPLPEAANRYGLSEAALRRAVRTGIIRGGMFGEQLCLREDDVQRMRRRGMYDVPTLEKTMTAEIEPGEPRLISIEDAARKYEIPVGVLERLIEEHRIRIQNNGSRMLFEEDVKAVRHLSRARFRHLEGRGITLSEAQKKYGIPVSTTSQWVQKKKIREVKREGKYLYVNESDVAYAKLLAKELGMKRRKGVLPDKVYIE